MTSEGLGERILQQTWSDAIARYERVKHRGASIQAMLELCRHIGASPLASGLFVSTSMFDLGITQTPRDDVRDSPCLWISPRLEGQIEFRYVDTRVKADQWHRTVKTAEALPRLLKFLDQLHWFPSEMLQG